MTTSPPKAEVLRAPQQVGLDALRAFAANLVVVGHALNLYFPQRPRLPLGSFAVAVFFLLSGFLITSSVLSRPRIEAPRLPAFVADRIARILTPYLPALLLVALLDAGLGLSRQGMPGLNAGPLAFVGNALLLQDYPLFQAADVLGHDVAWRIRPYNSAEPFWTVAIEFWIYAVFAGVFFTMVRGERLRRVPLAVMMAVALPVFLWNLGGGAGKALSLVWLLGSVAALVNRQLVAALADRAIARLGALVLALAALALGAKVKKYGFDPYDLQTTALIALAMFGSVWLLRTVDGTPRWLNAGVHFFAAYSYSLYLIHNTALVAFLDHPPFGDPLATALAAAVAAHALSFALWWAFERHHKRVSAWLRPPLERLFLPARGPAKASRILH